MRCKEHKSQRSVDINELILLEKWICQKIGAISATRKSQAIVY